MHVRVSALRRIVNRSVLRQFTILACESKLKYFLSKLSRQILALIPVGVASPLENRHSQIDPLEFDRTIYSR
jgi:hypothetical protein